MSPRIGVQTLLNRFLPEYQNQHPLTPPQQKACWHIQQCRTPALGGLQLQCHHCGVEQAQYHSCRDRHCSQCQGAAQHAWCERQSQMLLPVTYFHVVFTLPHQLNGWVELHPKLIYRLLFQSVWATLQAFGQDPKRLNGTLGMTAVLHTWGQNLSRHVHLHCLIPGGALSETGDWNPAKSNYLFPVKALSRYYRGKLVSLLRQVAERGELHRVSRPGEIDATLKALMKTEWVVYSKACLNRPETVVEYLARYSRKTAISDARILGISQNQVELRYKDYSDHHRNKVMALDGIEFIRRFLLHILPKGFMRIRHYGFLANRCRKQKLAQIRETLQNGDEPAATCAETKTSETHTSAVSLPKSQRCQKCRTGILQVVYEISPKRRQYGGS